VILDASLVLITVFDVNTRILSFNKKCETVFGISKKDAIGKTFAEVFRASSNQRHLQISRGHCPGNMSTTAVTNLQ
jgi:PAS domain S-box-containing protein